MSIAQAAYYLIRASYKSPYHSYRCLLRDILTCFRLPSLPRALALTPLPPFPLPPPCTPSPSGVVLTDRTSSVQPFEYPILPLRFCPHYDRQRRNTTIALSALPIVAYWYLLYTRLLAPTYESTASMSELDPTVVKDPLAPPGAVFSFCQSCTFCLVVISLLHTLVEHDLSNLHNRECANEPERLPRTLLIEEMTAVQFAIGVMFNAVIALAFSAPISYFTSWLFKLPTASHAQTLLTCSTITVSIFHAPLTAVHWTSQPVDDIFEAFYRYFTKLDQRDAPSQKVRGDEEGLRAFALNIDLRATSVSLFFLAHPVSRLLSSPLHSSPLTPRANAYTSARFS